MTSTTPPTTRGKRQAVAEKALGRRARGRRKKREPGRGHYDKDRPAIIAWVTAGRCRHPGHPRFHRQDRAKSGQPRGAAGSRLYTDSASSYRVVKGYMHEYVNHTQKEYARGDVHENRAECLSPSSSRICPCFAA